MGAIKSIVLLGLLGAALAAQPMSGNYTVDNSAPTGGANYASLPEATQALMLRGVGGPVEFSVLPGSGAYSGFQLGPVTGTSATNTITFRGVGYPVLQGGVSVTTPAGSFGHTIHLYATSYNGLGTYLLGTGPSYVTLEGLEVTNGFALGWGAIVAMGCSHLTLRDCRIHDSLSAVTAGFSPNTLVESCEIWNISPSNPATYAGGSYAAILVAALSDDSVLRGNRIHDCVHTGVYIGGQLNPSTGIAFTPSVGMIFANNMMWNVTGRPAYAESSVLGVLAVYGAPEAVVANNSIAVSGGVANALQLATTSIPAFVVDNVIKHDGTGACIAFSAIPTAPPTILDFNLYDAGPAAAVAAAGPILYGTIAAWQAYTGKEASSMTASCGFVSATDLHLAHDSAARLSPGMAIVQVSDDIDGNPRDPVAPCRGADEFVLSLRLRQPDGAGTVVSMRDLSLVPGGEYYNVFSLEPCAPIPGGGPYLGLCASTAGEIQGLTAQLLLPVGAVPFHFIAATTTQDFGPYLAPPVTVEGVCFEFTGGVIGEVSAVERLTIY